MTIADRVLGTAAALLVVLGAAHRAMNPPAQAVAAVPEQQTSMTSYSSARFPPQNVANGNLVATTDDGNQAGKISRLRSEIPHTLVAQSSSSIEQPAASQDEAASDAQDQAADDSTEMYDTSDQPTIIIDQPVPEPDVRTNLGPATQMAPWELSDQQVYDTMLRVMSNDERATFQAEWLNMTAEERQNMLLQGRMAILGQ